MKHFSGRAVILFVGRENMSEHGWVWLHWDCVTWICLIRLRHSDGLTINTNYSKLFKFWFMLVVKNTSIWNNQSYQNNYGTERKTIPKSTRIFAPETETPYRKYRIAHNCIIWEYTRFVEFIERERTLSVIPSDSEGTWYTKDVTYSIWKTVVSKRQEL